jgi:hypothetical protein
LFVVATVVGAVAGLAGHPVHAGAAPLFAHWLPHVGPGTPLAPAVAAAVVWRGPEVATRLGWRRLLGAGYVASVAWTLALALVDGWQRGLAGRLTTQFEYLSEVGGVTGVPAMLRSFSGRILDGGPDPWTTHVAGHPPGALLVFVGLDRIGLGGGGWAALACVSVGSLVAVAVPVTLRALANEEAARAALPFLVLFPGAIWVGASADGLFAGVAATGLSLLAIGLTRPSRLATLAAGVLLSFAAYLSYGLVLLAALALVVVLAAGHTRPLPRALDPTAMWALVGGAAVVFAFTASGFWWVDGYHLVQQRYYQGLASHRPYAYWVWANLAALAASAGPAAAPILRRAVIAAQSTMVSTAGRVISSTVGPFDRRYAQATPDRGRVPGADQARAHPRGRFSRLHRAAGLAARRAMFPAGGGAAHKTRAEALQPQCAAVPGRADQRPGGTPPPAGPRPAAVIWLPLAALAAILLADLSGLSKAEVERIWLPFAVWLPAGAILLPTGDRRGWLAVQASTALLLNHLLLTAW